MYVVLNEAGRVLVSSMDSLLPGAVEMAVPEGFDALAQGDWRAENGALVYDPLPEPEPGVDPVEALQAENALLRAQVQALAERGEFVEDCMAELAMLVYGGV